MDKRVNVKFNGGRECSGTLKGYDALMNLVLDDVEEVMRGMFSFPSPSRKGSIRPVWRGWCKTRVVC
jgi:small nuclear ribonucleoprotein (snRNP)-like protein